VKLHAIEKFTTGFVYYARFLILVLFCEIWEFGHSFFIEQAITVISFGFNLQELNTLPGNKISNLYTEIFVFIFPINTCLKWWSLPGNCWYTCYQSFAAVFTRSLQLMLNSV
jgi:hypothetical protein